MDAANGVPSTTKVKKQDDTDAGNDTPKQETKTVVVKTLNRVPRACNACRKQKMRCEGADNPPCKRCRHAGLECLFEKPSREATLTGEAGLERIRSLESQVSDIRQTQFVIHNTLTELVAHLRGAPPMHLQPAQGQPYHVQSPNAYTNGSPSLSSASGTTPMMVDQMQAHGMSSLAAGVSSDTAVTSPHGPISPMLSNPSVPRPRGPSFPGGPSYRSPSLTAAGQRPPGPDNPQMSPANVHFPRMVTMPNSAPGPTLPPISSLHGIGPQQPILPRPHPSTHYHPSDRAMSPQSRHKLSVGGTTSPKRPAPGQTGSSNVTSANSSDGEDDDNGELPASGLVAPWEVLRGLADVAIERAAKEQGERSEPPSRARSPDPKHQRPAKRRKTQHNRSRTATFPDVVTKKIISEAEARELFRIFYHGCSTFLPVFDSNVDTYEALHERSPFAVDCICMVAARVRDGGGPQSDTYLKCLEEVQAISCATLFSPVSRQEAVQAMVLVSGWSDNGWLSGGHAVRMALELSMHKAWPKLLRRMKAGKSSTSPEDRELVISARTWFCLYLFEHQLSYGTGRPAILKDDESIWQCRHLLQHPLAIEDDMRLVSTVELMAIRERVHNDLSPFDRPVDDHTFETLRKADMEFRSWYATWDHAFSQKYEDAAFYRQSLQIQQLLAELFHNATALRGIHGLDDVEKMHSAQRQLAVRSIQIAQQALDITVNSPAYREGMKYAVHYTHATATFAASFLLRLARLFPEDCDMHETREHVERLAKMMAELPGKRYAPTLYLMLKRSKKRKAGSSRSPKLTREAVRPPQVNTDVPPVDLSKRQEIMSPTYEPPFPIAGSQDHSQMSIGGMSTQFTADAANLDHIWRGFEMTSNEQLPVWLSDQSLGGHSFSQFGMEAFMLPAEYDLQRSSAPQIW